MSQKKLVSGHFLSRNGPHEEMSYKEPNYKFGSGCVMCIEMQSNILQSRLTDINTSLAEDSPLLIGP